MSSTMKLETNSKTFKDVNIPFMTVSPWSAPVVHTQGREHPVSRRSPHGLPRFCVPFTWETRAGLRSASYYYFRIGHYGSTMKLGADSKTLKASKRSSHGSPILQLRLLYANASMFRAPDGFKGRVGFTGSGPAMREDPTRSRHVYQPNEALD
ncbi:hypothetical protein B0H63DRAFT_565734 [Podospora didyma]|uniref:Uncharacterized protein n=1 Tax=Podospora didyma TaxID=330526 RepID=A0AAE0K1P9_9PEZI|nr:hypothetical protein B0H63DRAFT_565734 [Podospora didyma]